MLARKKLGSRPMRNRHNCSYGNDTCAHRSEIETTCFQLSKDTKLIGKLRSVAQLFHPAQARWVSGQLTCPLFFHVRKKLFSVFLKFCLSFF